MEIKELRKQYIRKEQEKAAKLYIKWGSLRKVAALVGKSPEWVRTAVRTCSQVHELGTGQK